MRVSKITLVFLKITILTAATAVTLRDLAAIHSTNVSDDNTTDYLITNERLSSDYIERGTWNKRGFSDKRGFWDKRTSPERSFVGLMSLKTLFRTLPLSLSPTYIYPVWAARFQKKNSWIDEQPSPSSLDKPRELIRIQKQWHKVFWHRHISGIYESRCQESSNGHLHPAKIQIRLRTRAVIRIFTGCTFNTQRCKISLCGQRRLWSHCTVFEYWFRVFSDSHFGSFYPKTLFGTLKN